MYAIRLLGENVCSDPYWKQVTILGRNVELAVVMPFAMRDGQMSGSKDPCHALYVTISCMVSLSSVSLSPLWHLSVSYGGDSQSESLPSLHLSIHRCTLVHCSLDWLDLSCCDHHLTCHHSVWSLVLCAPSEREATGLVLISFIARHFWSSYNMKWNASVTCSACDPLRFQSWVWILTTTAC